MTEVDLQRYQRLDGAWDVLVMTDGVSGWERVTETVFETEFKRGSREAYEDGQQVILDDAEVSLTEVGEGRELRITSAIGARGESR